MSATVVIVTGGGRGIGRAVCERFARAGASVIAAARSESDLQETRRLVAQRGGVCRVQPTDVCREGQVASLIEFTRAQYGRIDVLVNNAGVAPSRSIEELDPAQFDALVALNIRALYACCRAVWPVMKAQGAGVIVNISSVASVECFPGFLAYGASKAWVNAWTKGLAEEGKASGIRAYAVAPGAVETSLLRAAFPDFPVDQTLQPSDVAEQVFAVTQPDCGHESGEIIFVRKE